MAEEKKENTVQELNIKEPARWWVTLIVYLVEFAVASGLAILSLYLRDVFITTPDTMTLYRYLADAFTIPGIVFIMLGFLVILSAHGAFLGLGYIFKRAGRVLLPFIFRKDETYYEYLEARKEHHRSLRFLSFMIVGLIFMAAAIVFIILFYKIHG